MQWRHRHRNLSGVRTPHTYFVDVYDFFCFSNVCFRTVCLPLFPYWLNQIQSSLSSQASSISFPMCLLFPPFLPSVRFSVYVHLNWFFSLSPSACISASSWWSLVCPAFLSFFRFPFLLRSARTDLSRHSERSFFLLFSFLRSVLLVLVESSGEESALDLRHEQRREGFFH